MEGRFLLENGLLGRGTDQVQSNGRGRFGRFCPMLRPRSIVTAKQFDLTNIIKTGACEIGLSLNQLFL